MEECSFRIGLQEGTVMGISRHVGVLCFADSSFAASRMVDQNQPKVDLGTRSGPHPPEF